MIQQSHLSEEKESTRSERCTHLSAHSSTGCSSQCWQQPQWASVGKRMDTGILVNYENETLPSGTVWVGPEGST